MPAMPDSLYWVVVHTGVPLNNASVPHCTNRLPGYDAEDGGRLMICAFS